MNASPPRLSIKSLALICVNALLGIHMIACAGDKSRAADTGHFNRIAVFPVCENSSCLAENETVAEIVAATQDGNTLVYTDSESQKLGFVDITNPKRPQAAGTLALDGEPTSVAVKGRYALVCVNTSLDFVNTSGKLIVVDIRNQTRVTELDLGGQPDAIAVSPNGRYAAVAIENERDEDLGSGEPPQSPSGLLVIVDLKGRPQQWSTRAVNLNGIADRYPFDVETEFVDINKQNIAVISLQENNYLVLVDLKTGRIVRHFSAGQVNLNQIDTVEEEPALISLSDTLRDIPREPDGVAWLSDGFFATADEGDLFGGSRGFTLFNNRGGVVFSSGNTLDHHAVRLGHYPDGRSKNKGNEPENVEYGVYNKQRYLFVGSERANLIFVYHLLRQHQHNITARLAQILPAGIGPEGLLAIPQRNLFIVASEKDSREDKFRSVINIYKLNDKQQQYPTLVSKNRKDNTPIPWGALSGLAYDNNNPRIAYTIHDSFYQQSRIFKLNIAKRPAAITDEIVLYDRHGALASVEPVLANPDGTVNLDAEGIAVRKQGGFWIASEGDDAPLMFRNLLLRVNRAGVIKQVVTLPDSVTHRMQRFGFEGVANVGAGANEIVYVAFQREWDGDPANHVRIGRYAVATDSWTFMYYPLATASSPNGGWVGLSELSHLGKQSFAVIERDNQAGPDARIKRIYRFSVANIEPKPDANAPDFPVLKKTLIRDLIPDLKRPGGLVLEKIEGMMVLPNGTTLIINDNDGVDDSNGETQLLRLPRLFR